MTIVVLRASSTFGRLIGTADDTNRNDRFVTRKLFAHPKAALV